MVEDKRFSGKTPTTVADNIMAAKNGGIPEKPPHFTQAIKILAAENNGRHILDTF